MILSAGVVGMMYLSAESLDWRPEDGGVFILIAFGFLLGDNADDEC